MAEPTKPTRREIGLFARDQRTIKAIEKIFDLLPTDLEAVLDIAQIALDNANKLKVENTELKKKVDTLEAELLSLKKINLRPILRRLEHIEALEGIR